MPLTNGDAGANPGRHLAQKEVLDFSTAREILETEYPEKDGLDAKTLLNSHKNGGLTYNDFLVLPGYIGTHKSQITAQTLLIWYQVFQLPM